MRFYTSRSLTEAFPVLTLGSEKRIGRPAQDTLLRQWPRPPLMQNAVPQGRGPTKHFWRVWLSLGVRLHIAIAEDNPSDLAQLESVLKELGLDYWLTTVADGEQARDFILKRGRYSNYPPADLIFLDMNMPKLTGLEVLRAVPDSADLPVCVLTGSEKERRLVEQHFAPKKASYLSKPVNADQILSCLDCHDHLRPLAKH
ncbi:MAG: response regulator [Acidobacteriota bacterium]